MPRHRRDIGASRPVLRAVGKAAKNEHNLAGIEEIEMSGPRHAPPFAVLGGALAATALFAYLLPRADPAAHAARPVLDVGAGRGLHDAQAA